MPLPRQAVTAFEQALEAQSVPGSNLRGAVDGANWCFLLSRLELGKVLAVGCPAPSALATIARLGDEVIVLAASADHERLRQVIENRGLANVTILSAERDEALPLADDDCDLVVVASRRLAGRIGAEELARVLKPDGSLYLEPPRLDLRRRGVEPLLVGAGRREDLWAAPAWGELRFAAPAADKAAVTYVKHRFFKPLFRRTLAKRPGKVAAKTPLANALARRRALLVRSDGPMPETLVPPTPTGESVMPDAEDVILKHIAARPAWSPARIVLR